MSNLNPDTIRDEFNQIIAQVQDKDYSKSEFREFYDDLIEEKWDYDTYELLRLMEIYDDHYAGIQKSIATLGSTHIITNKGLRTKEKAQIEENIQEILDNKEKYKSLSSKTQKDDDPLSKLIKKRNLEQLSKSKKIDELEPISIKIADKSKKSKDKKSKEYKEKEELPLDLSEELSLVEIEKQPRHMNVRPMKKKKEIESTDMTSLDDSQSDVQIEPEIFPSRNVFPTRYNARNDLNSEVITHDLNRFNQRSKEEQEKIKEKYDLIPSTDKSLHKYLKFYLKGDEKTSEHYKPDIYQTLYRPDEAKKIVAPSKTWMFDVMYFSDYNGKKNDFLVGININTRYAVVRRIKSKSAPSFINSFKDLLNNELKDKMRILIFDGETAVGSTRFLQFAKLRGFRVIQTHSKIHTQTALIDRLCRTIRQYFKKAFITKHKEVQPYLDKYYERDNPIYLDKLIGIDRLFSKDPKYRKDKLVPIPSKYNLNELDEEGISDEIEDIIDYYNNKPHNGLIRLLKEACKIFKTQLNLDKNEITPYLVHNNPQLERLIIQYCIYYNTYLVKQSHQYKDGDPVYVHRTIIGDGSLKVNRMEYLDGKWWISRKKNEIYYVTNFKRNQYGQLIEIAVSKYMLTPRNDLEINFN